MHFIACFYHVMSTFQSESTFYSCLNVKELLALNRWHICRLSDCNENRTHNHLVRVRTLNHLVKLAEWLSCVVSSYMYCAFTCMYSHHVRYEFPSKFILYKWLNVKELLAQSERNIWGLRDWNDTRFHNHLARKQTPKTFRRTGQMSELCCELLSARWI